MNINVPFDCIFVHDVHVDVLRIVWYTLVEVIEVPCSEARKRANAAYNRRQDNIMIRPSKEEGAKIRKAAAEAGMSVQAFILSALRKTIGYEPDAIDGQEKADE